MRDHYSPGRRGQGQGNAYDDRPPAFERPPDSYYAPRHDYYDRRSPPPRDRYYDGYDARAPPPSSYHPQPPPRNDRARDYDRVYGSRGDQFTFKGAASGDLRRPQEEFSFRAQAPSLPSSLPTDQWGSAVPHKAQRMRDGGRIPGAHERRDRDAHRPMNGSRGGRGQDRGRGRGRGGFRGFGPKPAHNRDILSGVGREPTPEQMEGMNGGEARFRALSSSSEDEDESDNGSDNEPVPRKRTKVTGDAETSVPKWSNPDVYHLAPVPAENETVKRDLVDEIRRAKAEPVTVSKARNDVAENADFISFGMDDDAMTIASSSPAPAEGNDTARFSHRDHLHGKIPSNNDSASSGNRRSSFTPINGHIGLKAPPAPGSTEHGGPPPRPLNAMQPVDSQVAPVSTTSFNNRKRKHRGEAALGDIVEDWETIDGQDPTPWCEVDHSDTAGTGLRLHKEVCDFFDFMSPRDFEEAARNDLIVRLQRAVRSWQGAGAIARNADVICFGSFASGLYLPTADMDVVAITPQYTQSGLPSLGTSMTQLRKLADHFTKIGMAKAGTATFIWGAKVPLVKFVDRQTGLKVDLSFENESGYTALDTFKTWKTRYPAMPALVAIVKQMLAMRGLNEVFNGGIGGFTTICLVVHLLQTMPELQAGSMDSTQHYGELLMKFLDLYGNKFNHQQVGIMMRHPYLFDKAKTKVAAKVNMERLTIIDPNRDNNDIAGGSRHIVTVFDCFRRAFNALQRELVNVHTGKINVKSVLDCIIGGNYESVVNQRKRLEDLFGGHAASMPSLPPPPPPAPATSAPHRSRPLSNSKPNPKSSSAKAGRQQNQSAPFAQPPQANQGTKAAIKPTPLEIPEGASKKEADKLKTEHGNKMRAYDFKRKHPNVPKVPNMLTRGEQRKLLDKVAGGKRKK